MNKKQLILFCVILMAFCHCSGSDSFYANNHDKSKTEEQLTNRKRLLTQGNLFDFLDSDMSVWEKDAMNFLYAYMPIGDITDYEGSFYLENIRASLKAREEMPWGSTIPNEIFRHFVLPVRVNNENLDNSRTIFYNELKDRVKDLPLYDAVLEVNHWCHEKVTYTPSDSRTSSPLASVRTAYGRCGEESTFTVAALRAVGIPARQVYTPRWAHTDDNHAWVEAWVDGKWYFLGACEPEPVLNMGWFNGPVYRGMLMHTKVFGHYNGPEEIMAVTPSYTEINVTSNYAPTAKINIRVVDKDNNPIQGAHVEFKIYNYANFYTVAEKITDSKGNVSLSAGKGDMLAWVTHQGLFGFGKASFGKDENIVIKLGEENREAMTFELDIVPPVNGTIETNVTEEQINTNAKRLEEETTIRNNYIATFYDEDRSRELAAKTELDPEKIWKIMIASRGNWQEIEQFLLSVDPPKRSIALNLLEVISAKDLRDTPASVLTDHLNNSANSEEAFFNRYILNPRVSNELLTPYRSFLRNAFTPENQQQFSDNPETLVQWVKENISINDSLNPQQIPVMPVGVWKARTADLHSCKIFFVSLARSLNIPACIEPVAQKVQYYKNGWRDVNLKEITDSQAAQGFINAGYKPTKILPDPKYYNHFTISRILPSGRLQTMNLRSSTSQADMGTGNSLNNMQSKAFTVDEGSYLLTTGTRLANGSVLNRNTFFEIKEGQTTPIEIVLRQSEEDVQVIGNLDAEAKFLLADSKKETSILSTTGRGYFIVGILGSRQEPTNHAVRDIVAQKSEFDNWGRGMILLFKDGQNLTNFDPKEFGELPSTVTLGIDENQKITQMICSAMNLSNTNSLPIFVIADTFGRIVFVSQGYTIGLGEQMMRVINKL